MKQEKLTYILLIVVAAFNVLVSTYILVNQTNGQRNGLKQRTSIQQSTDRIECILLINPQQRTAESVKGCDK